MLEIELKVSRLKVIEERESVTFWTRMKFGNEMLLRFGEVERNSCASVLLATTPPLLPDPTSTLFSVPPSPAVVADKCTFALVFIAVSVDASFSNVARGGDVACFVWPVWEIFSTANDIFSASVDLAFVPLTSTSVIVERL